MILCPILRILSAELVVGCTASFCSLHERVAVEDTDMEEIENRALESSGFTEDGLCPTCAAEQAREDAGDKAMREEKES